MVLDFKLVGKSKVLKKELSEILDKMTGTKLFASAQSTSCGAVCKPSMKHNVYFALAQSSTSGVACYKKK